MRLPTYDVDHVEVISVPVMFEELIHLDCLLLCTAETGNDNLLLGFACQIDAELLFDELKLRLNSPLFISLEFTNLLDRLHFFNLYV